MEFDIALGVADEAIFLKTGRRLVPVEVAILEGAWERQTYEQIVRTVRSLLVAVPTERFGFGILRQEMSQLFSN
jgi:hypothetical protein